jgi:sugar lactone lactonase YvrE
MKAEEGKMRHRRAAVILASMLLGAALSPAAALQHVDTLLTFSEGAGESPEGIAIDKQQTIYVSFPFTGEVRAIAKDLTSRTFATLPAGPGFGPLGMAVDGSGTLYVAVATFDPATHGVYRVDRQGKYERLVGSSAINFPNDVTLDPRGNIYVSDTSLGGVWRIERGGGAPSLWFQSDLLEGDNSGPLADPLGANGIEYRHNALYVANTELGRIVRIPILPDGSAGTPEVFAESPALRFADGMAFDVHGNLYVAVNAQNTIVRVSATGSELSTIATVADGLDSPAAVAFGTGAGERQTLFLVNFSISELFGQPPGSGPSLQSLDAGVVGAPTR